MLLRRPPRYSVQLPVSLTWNATAEGTAHNLSERGCLIQSNARVAEGDYFTLTFGLRREDQPLMVRLAAVRWTKGGAFGTEFLLWDPEEQERLRRYLATCWIC